MSNHVTISQFTATVYATEFDFENERENAEIWRSMRCKFFVSRYKPIYIYKMLRKRRMSLK